MSAPYTSLRSIIVTVAERRGVVHRTLLESAGTAESTLSRYLHGRSDMGGEKVARVLGALGLIVMCKRCRREALSCECGGIGIVRTPSERLIAAMKSYLRCKSEHSAAVGAYQTARSNDPDGRETEGSALGKLAQEEHYSEEAADKAFGCLARVAEREGFRACLSGEIVDDVATARRPG